MNKHSLLNVLRIQNYATSVSTPIFTQVDITIAKANKEDFSDTRLFLEEYLTNFGQPFVSSTSVAQIVDELCSFELPSLVNNYDLLLQDTAFFYYLNPIINELCINLNISDYNKLTQTANDNNYFHNFESDVFFLLIHINLVS